MRQTCGMAATVAPMPRPPADLTPAQRRRLRAALAGVARAEARATALLRELIDEGASAAAIGRELGVSRQAVHDRLQRARADAPASPDTASPDTETPDSP